MIELKHEPPTVEDYRNLRKVAGLSEKSRKAAEKVYLMHVLMSQSMINRH